jgi:hypothetical protein
VALSKPTDSFLGMRTTLPSVKALAGILTQSLGVLDSSLVGTAESFDGIVQADNNTQLIKAGMA